MDVFQVLRRTIPGILPTSIIDNQQFLDHFNQYIYSEWAYYYFAYDILKKEYRRIKRVPKACSIFEKLFLKEMRRVYQFLVTILEESEEDLKIVHDTIEALQVTLSVQSEADLHKLVMSLSSQAVASLAEVDEGGGAGGFDAMGSESGEKGMESNGDDFVPRKSKDLPHPRTNPLDFLRQSMRTIAHIARKVETIVLDEDHATRKAKQLDHNIELAIRSVYAILSRCEQFFKLNNYAIRKMGKRMEKLYRRRPIEEIPPEEFVTNPISMRAASSSAKAGAVKRHHLSPLSETNEREEVINILLQPQREIDEEEAARDLGLTLATSDKSNSSRHPVNSSKKSDKAGKKEGCSPRYSHKAWRDTPSGMFYYFSFLRLNEQVGRLKQKCIDLYSIKFKQSHSELAAFELEFVENKDKNYRDTTSFIGFKLGVILSITFWLVMDSLASNNNNLEFWKQPALYVYTTIFNILLYRLCWGMDIAIWTHYGVNFISVLELSNLKSNLLFVINQTTTLMTLFFISLLVFYRANGSKHMLDNSFVSYGSPLLLMVASLAIQIYQTFFYYKHDDSSRGLFNKRVVFGMLGAPLVPLTFRDGYAADVLTSFTKIIADSLYAGCWVVSGSFIQNLPDGDQDESKYQELSHYGSDYLQCKSNDMVMAVTILQLIPLITRLLQCFRGLYENNFKLFPFAFNAWKYMLSILVVVFAVENWATQDIYLFLVVMTTLYKWWWDIAMDWGLLETFPESWSDFFNIKNLRHKKFFLRSSLMYPHPAVYYVCILVNLVLRFIWVLSLTPMTYLGGLVGAKLSLFMGSMEIIRRSMWGLFRVEWEHVKSVRNDTPGYLPTHVLRKHEWSAKYGNHSDKEVTPADTPKGYKKVSNKESKLGIPKRSSMWIIDPQDNSPVSPLLTLELPHEPYMEQDIGLEIT